LIFANNPLFNKYLNGSINIEDLVLSFEESDKNIGKVYTPKYISDYIVSSLNPTLEEIILEPSVGHGMFIFSLLEFIEDKYSLNSAQLKEYFIKNVFAIDIQQSHIIELNTLIKLFFKKRNIEIVINENLIIGNSLFVQHLLPKNIDIVFGNPPYVRVKNISDNDLFLLKKNYTSCSKGNIDLYYAFIEYAVLNAKRASFIVPNSWLYNSSAKNLRELIKPYLVSVIDFKDKMIFKNADTYTSIFLFNKKINSNVIKYGENINSFFIEKIKGDLNDKRWSFGTTVFSNIPIVSYHTPIATLSDKIYINSGLKKNIVPFYKLSKIKSEKEFFDKEENILFPYDNSNTIIEESHLDIRTLKYLNNNKEILINRDKGKTDKYPTWYAYGRKQGLNNYREDTFFIIIPGMISKTYKFFSIKSSKIKKPFLFSSGFILEVESIYVEDLINFLNSDKFKEYIITNGKVWKGKTPYYSLNMTQLKEVFTNTIQ